MSRRARRTLVTAAAALVALASAAGAAERVPDGQRWGGSRVDRPAPMTDPAARTVTITGNLRDNGLLIPRPKVTATFAAPAPGCPGIGDLSLAVHGTTVATNRGYSGSTDLPTDACNGSYRVAVQIDGVERLDTVLIVDLPAPEVTGVTATPDQDGRRITVAWEDARGRAADLEGYTVERRIGSGEFQPVAALAADATTYVDQDLPASGGEATYRVISHRPSPSGPRVSAASSSEPTRFEPGPADAPGNGGATGGGGGGETGAGTGGSGSGGGDGAGDGPAGSGTAPGPLRGGSTSRVRPPRTGVSRSFLPPLGGPRVSPDQVTPTTLDDGYDEELPYDPIDGPLEAEVPDDELAGFFTERAPGQGMVVPVATALVLAVWAMHLRALARAGRPAG